MWRRVRRIWILPLLLFFLGLGTLLYPTLHGAIVDRKMKQDSQRFLTRVEVNDSDPENPSHQNGEDHPAVEVTVPEQYPELWQDMTRYNQEIFREGQAGLSGVDAYEVPSFYLADYGLDEEIFGVLSIPRLDLSMPIYLGATDAHMAAGVAHLSQTSLPIGGENTNCVLAGHRGWNGAAYFLYLPDLEPGDQVQLTNLWQTLNYQVVETKIIAPNQVEEIRIQKKRTDRKPHPFTDLPVFQIPGNNDPGPAALQRPRDQREKLIRPVSKQQMLRFHSKTLCGDPAETLRIRLRIFRQPLHRPAVRILHPFRDSERIQIHTEIQNLLRRTSGKTGKLDPVSAVPHHDFLSSIFRTSSIERYSSGRARISSGSPEMNSFSSPIFAP